jgi:hypothetical protein
MDIANFKATDVLKDIRSFCMECNGGSHAEAKKCTSIDCKLWKYRSMPLQVNLFDQLYKQQWITTVFNIADARTEPFWWSELRDAAAAAQGPGHPNWWGAVTAKLKRAGWVRRPEARKSHTGSRAGGTEFMWARKAVRHV